VMTAVNASASIPSIEVVMIDATVTLCMRLHLHQIPLRPLA
jgi:hypothetical protein